MKRDRKGEMNRIYVEKSKVLRKRAKGEVIRQDIESIVYSLVVRRGSKPAQSSDLGSIRVESILRTDL